MVRFYENPHIKMNIEQNIRQIKQLITQAEHESHREPGSVMLLAVSKQQKVSAIREAFQHGVANFGENYFQEAQEKILQLRDLPIHWHFIGPVQSNKTKGIASQFEWVHSIDRIKIAEKLSEYRPMDVPPLNVCIQINLVNEETKSGVSPEEAKDLAVQINKLPNLTLRGLMTIPPAQRDPQSQYALLTQLKELMESINQETGLHMDTLSMGMSDDLTPAIKAGSTIVRIGRAIFGDRQ